ncbi:hypothetical protein DFQ30_005529 [Apophysomyces sp. BC1015]|nr:hypothetical protein DFQ30_005529 [Apophysomyces sp. BC1015]
MSLARKTAIITGATRGIGFGIANAFAREGVQTILIGRDSDRVHAVQNTFVETYGDGHKGVVLNISSGEDIDITLKKNEDLESTINTNLLGTIRMCKHVGKAMMRKRQGNNETYIYLSIELQDY